jgi:hypothetical protein
LIDSDVSAFPVDLLKKWKKEAEDNALVALATPGAPVNQLTALFGKLDEDDLKYLHNLSLPKDDNVEAVSERLGKAAQSDITAFQGTLAWPQNAIELNLTLKSKNKKDNVSLTGIANAIGTFCTLSIVSPPGTGKSTTLVQLSGKIVAGGAAVPILFPLGEWSGTGKDFFEFITRRNAFHSFRQQHFQR